jgi:TetR/AcrR family transcriptional regulator, transcriptional repressor for nem operon
MARTSDAKERLLASALELFSERSYANVGVQELCEHAGVKKGSFYYFFKSKQDLMLEALEHQSRAIGRMILTPAFCSNLPPLERIERLFHLTYEFQKAMKEKTGRVRGCFFGNLALELSTQDESIRHRLDRIFRTAITSIEKTVQDAVSAGDLADIDVAATAEAILAYWEGVIMLAKVRNDPGLLKDLAKGAKELAITETKDTAG